jgi:hypothetical protein
MGKFLSIILIVIGASVFLSGSYMGKEVALRGEEMEQSAGHQRPVPLVGPVRKEAAIESNEAVQKQQWSMHMWMRSSEQNVGLLHTVGAVIFIIGAGWLVFLSVPRRHGRR